MRKYLQQITFGFIVISASTLLTFSCNYSKPQLTPAEIRDEQKSLTQFTGNLAGTLSVRGPIAWEDYIDTSANFFMADVGQLVFHSGPTARQFIRDTLSKSITNIKLEWINMRIDPLSSNVAAIGSDYHEDITNSGGVTASYDGYFTATALLTGDKWKLRNAHWSEKTK